MNWIRMGLTVFAGGLVASLTDWLFMGDWLYKRFNRNPEIWRHADGKGEMTAIAWSAPLPFVTSAVFAFLCVRLNLHSFGATLKLALAICALLPPAERVRAVSDSPQKLGQSQQCELGPVSEKQKRGRS